MVDKNLPVIASLSPFFLRWFVADLDWPLSLGRHYISDFLGSCWCTFYISFLSVASCLLSHTSHSHLTQRVAQMSSLEHLYQTLRDAGLEALAPALLTHGVRSVNHIALRFPELIDAGLASWQLESILAQASQRAEAPLDGDPKPGRADLPAVAPQRRANLMAALEAASPNNRALTLKRLEDDILAKSSCPANDARLRTYLAICRAWEVAAFPLDTQNLRCFAGSLKAGGYKSSAIYFSTICGHQQRALRTSISPLIRQTIKDCIRSIQRGAGTSKLKDSFNGMLLNLVPISETIEPFNLDNVSHARDMVAIGLWFMLRESEMANCKALDIQLNAKEVTLTIPLHKTDQRGQMTQRCLTCTCGVRAHRMCVWHAAERHVLRLEAHPKRGSGSLFPMFPTQDGLVPSKQQLIEAFRLVIQSTGTSLQRLGAHGEELHRFHGHVLRVSGAQMLTIAGVEMNLVQLLGRWTSSAIQRYTQDSALVRVPQITQQVLGDEPLHQPIQLAMAAPSTPAVAAPSFDEPVRKAAKPKASASDVRSLRAEMERLREAVATPKVTFVFRPRARILHKASQVEDHNAPHSWRTACGWAYGTSNFLRTSSDLDGSRKCKKCFELSTSSSSSSSETSGLSDLEVSSASSADWWFWSPAPWKKDWGAAASSGVENSEHHSSTTPSFCQSIRSLG